MKETVLKFYNNQPITDVELIEFLDQYLREVEQIPASGAEIQIITQLVKQGMFQIQDAMKKATRHVGLQLCEIYNKNGQLVSVRLEELK